MSPIPECPSSVEVHRVERDREVIADETRNISPQIFMGLVMLIFETVHILIPAFKVHVFVISIFKVV